MLLYKPMNSELMVRLSQIKQYINSLNDSIAVSNHSHAAAVVNKFKKAMSKSEQHVHANQFILDCLRTRNEKLRTQLFDLEQEKKGIQGRLIAAKNAPRQIEDTKAQICITRLTLSLNESKKVDYQEVVLRSDYKHVIVNSVLGQKYRDYTISIEEAQQLEHRGSLLYFCAIGEQVFHIIVKFKNDRDAYRWATCLRHAQLSLKNARKKDRLFEEEKEPASVAPQPPPNIPATSAQVFTNTTNLPPPLRGSMVKSTLGLPQVPFLNFNQQARISPSESGISDKRFNDKSYDREADKSGEKNTERSLVNALNFQAVRSSGTFNLKQTAPAAGTNYEKRLDLNRPPNLMKVRNNSNHDYSNTLDTLKVFKSGFRKQSEDIIKPHINQVYHEKMMENYRSQEQQDEIKSELVLANTVQPTITPPPQQEMSQKLRSLQQRKKELLKQSQHLTIDKPAFLFDNKVTWMGIEQMEDENKSKSSNRISNKSRRGSEFSESGVGASSEHVKRETEDNHSEHITEKSQQESPKLPKHTYEVPVPQKYAYPNGIVFQLHPVQKAQNSSPLIPSKEDTPQRLQRPSSSSSLDSEDDDHSDPSSHQNHTESQDNNARSQQLKKGIILTKCSQNGFWTHQKILYLSENNTELCSRDLKDKKIKKIKIANIRDVEYKKFDKGIIKHVNKIEQDKCFVIRALEQDGNIKNYEFVGNIAEPLEHFTNNLKLFVEYAKKE